MSDRTPWFIAAVAVGALGFVSAGAFHQNVANEIEKDKPGKLSVDFVQPAPLIGKLISLVCAGGVAGCLWIGLRDEQGQAIASAVATTEKPAIATQQASHPTQAIEYDEDPEVELEEVEQPIERVKEPAPKQQADIFDRIYTNHKRHLLIPAETGAGKTTLLLGAIEYGHQLFNGEIEFFCSTAKRSTWLGLEDQIADDGKPRVLFINPDEPATIQPLLECLKWLRKRLVNRGHLRVGAEQQGKPYRPRRNVIVLDEWNETLEVAKEYDRLFNLSKDKDESKSDAHGELLAFINSFARTGREDEMAVWAFGQDHQVQNAGINTGYRKNFAFLVPAKYGNTMGLEDALTGKTALVPVSKGKQIFADAEEISALHPTVAIAYSNIQGHEILITPHLPDIKRKRLFSASDRKVVQGRFPKAVGSDYQPEIEESPDPWS